MSRWAKKERYRDPGFFGGLCAVCRKKPREYTHAEYPSMCANCRQTRLTPTAEQMDRVIQDVSTARDAGMSVVLKRHFTDQELVEAGKLAREKLKQLGINYKPRVQNLNGELDPRIKALFKQEK